MTTFNLTINGTTYTINVKEDWTIDHSAAFSDFDRLETNMQTLRSMLVAIQYAIPGMSFTTTRDQTFIDFLNSINRIESNLEGIRTNFVTPPGYPGSKTWAVGRGFDFNDMNRLETDIRLLFQYAGLVYDSLVYCGTINCGYERGALPLM